MKWLWLSWFLVTSGAHAWTLEAPGLRGWTSETITIHFNPSSCTVAEATLNQLIDDAVNLWSGSSKINLKVVRDPVASTSTAAEFVAGTATDTPLIVCDSDFGNTLGVDVDHIPAATQLGTHNPINYGAVVLNATSGAAAIDRLSETELAVVIAHEMGHLLGLGHSGSSKALMYYSVGSSSLPVLTQDDEDGLSYLYPSAEYSAAPLGCAAVHEEKTSVTKVAGFLFAILMGVAFCSLVRLALRPRRGRDESVVQT
jgi:hypothetical protein